MDDVAFILNKSKSNFLCAWTEEDIKECKKRLDNLAMCDLILLRHSYYMTIHNPLYTYLIELLYNEETVRYCNALNNVTNDYLFDIIKETKNIYKIQKIGEILNARYDYMDKSERENVYNLLVTQGYIIQK